MSDYMSDLQIERRSLIRRLWDYLPLINYRPWRSAA